MVESREIGDHPQGGGLPALQGGFSKKLLTPWRRPDCRKRPPCRFLPLCPKKILVSRETSKQSPAPTYATAWQILRKGATRPLEASSVVLAVLRIGKHLQAAETGRVADLVAKWLFHVKHGEGALPSLAFSLLFLILEGEPSAGLRRVFS